YHVLFFNRYEDLVARSWIKTELVEPFESSGPSSSFQDKNSYHQQQAVKEANRASELSLKERRKKYGYIFRYKGFWNLPWDKKLWKKEDGPTASAMSADESETESGRGGDVRGSSLAEEGGMGELELYREPSCVSNGENEPD
ncbi:Dentin sialophosphoproteinlike, partial [Caligus rogercresseyi]